MNEPRSQTSTTGSIEELTEYLEQLLKWDRFRKAPGLRHLLEYLVQKTAEGRVDEIKESTIAIDVFGKSPEFDGRLDNIVRVQAHRLRKMLETYYQEEGAGDTLRISIAKGGYIPTIHRRDVAPVLDGAPVPPLHADGAAIAGVPPPINRPRWRIGPVPAGAGAFLLGVMVTAVLALWTAPSWTTAWITTWITGHRMAAGSEDPRRAPLATFWGSFLQPGVNCVVSFTNPVFLRVGSESNRVYLTYQGPLSAPVGSTVEISPGDAYVDPEFVKKGRTFLFSDSWTGTGEVLGIFRLTKLFTEAGHGLKVVRSRALTYADLRDANVVFLGSPWANELQDKVNPGQTPLVCEGSRNITNADPRPGEEKYYESSHDAKTKALTGTYALISVLPGVTRGTKIVSAAGVDTYGTSAGIDFITSAAGVMELIQRFDPQQKRRLPEFFQAVIRTEIVRGDPARSALVLVREVERKTLALEPRTTR